MVAAEVELQGSLRLPEGPSFKAAHFFRGDGQPGRLLMFAPHLAIDGISWRVLLEDMETILQATSIEELASGFHEVLRQLIAECGDAPNGIRI